MQNAFHFFSYKDWEKQIKLETATSILECNMESMHIKLHHGSSLYIMTTKKLVLVRVSNT